MFGSECLSEITILVKICQRNEVSSKGCRASIAHICALAVYHQFSLKPMAHNGGLRLATSSPLHSQNLPCSGLTLGVLASTLKTNAKEVLKFCVHSTHSWSVHWCTEISVYINDIQIWSSFYCMRSFFSFRSIK
jgi:hypothetical protein